MYFLTWPRLFEIDIIPSNFRISKSFCIIKVNIQSNRFVVNKLHSTFFEGTVTYLKFKYKVVTKS